MGTFNIIGSYDIHICKIVVRTPIVKLMKM